MKINNRITSKNKNSGITLIALVITIIVLLILAGVTIASLTGENGLLERASKAKEETAEGQAKEEVTIAWNGVQIDGKINGWDNTRKAQELQTELGNGATATVDGTDSNKINVTYKGYDIVINTEDGTVTIENSSIIIAEFKIEGTSVTTPPIPSGYCYVGGTIESGYVISDNVADENKYALNDDVGTDLLGNQFIWVPVDQDQVISLKVTSTEDITEMKLYDPFGDEINLGTASGKTYENTNITPTVNGGYYLKVTTASGSKTQTLGVHSLFEIDTWSDYYCSDEYIDYAINNWYGGSTEDFLDDYGCSSVEEYKIKGKAWMKNCSEPEDDIYYAERVATNGGFYVGRYEATYGASGALSKAGISTRTSSSTTLTEGMLWNCISQTDALSTAKAYNTDLKSSLLTGAAWDRTLGWLYETWNKTASQIVMDSKDWGNYNDDTFSGTTSLINTGAFTQTKANNIYDLAGNVSEWTTEANVASSRVGRGGSCGGDGSDSPASYRFLNNPSYTNFSIGFRLALYL